MIFTRNVVEKIVASLDTDGYEAARITKLAGDASSRTYYRIEPEGGESVILMKLAPEPFRADEITKGDPPEELPFINVQRFLKKGNLPVPEVFFVDIPLKVIILEDLGDLTMESVIRGEPSWRADLYRAAVDLLIEMQVFTASGGADDCVAYGRKFDYDLLMWEFEHFHRYCLLELGKRRPSAAEEEMLFAVYREISSELSNVPYIFAHRDFQSRNLMVQGKRLRLIDFQDALLAPMPYDLTALLRDSYVKLTAGEIEFLVNYYIEKRNARCCDGLTGGEFWRWFHLQTIQRKLKDAGRFVYIDRVKMNPKFLPNIPVSLGYAVGAIKALGSHGEFMDLIMTLIGDHVNA